MDKSLKTIGLTALAFIGYRAYKLYELGNSFDYEFYGLKFQRPANLQDALNKYQMVLIFKIINPTKTSLQMRGLEGSIMEGTDKLGVFKTGKFTIGAGDTFLNVVVDLEPKYVAKTLIPSILAKYYPTLDIDLTTIFPFGLKYKEKFKIDLKEHIKPSSTTIFQ